MLWVIIVLIRRIILSLVLVFYFLSQPLAFACTLLITALFWALTMNVFYSGWLGFLLFLIYIGGVIIIFAYVTALIPNVIFKPISKWIFALIAVVPLIGTGYFYDYSTTSRDFAIFPYKIYGVQLVGVRRNFVFIALALVLLFNLVGVIKFCYSTGISLRPFKYA